MTSKELFRLRALQDILLKPTAEAGTKNDILNQLNEVLHREGHSTIGDRTLDNLFHQLEELGAPVRALRVKSPTNGRMQHVRFIERKSALLESLISEEQEAGILSAIRELEGIEGDPFIDELRLLLAQKVEEYEADPSTQLIVHTEGMPTYAGLVYLNGFYNAIKNKTALHIRYRPFEKAADEFKFSPYLLKKYNHRWFCLGRIHETPLDIVNLALDRVKSPPVTTEGFIPSKYDRSDWNDRFQEIVGVTFHDDITPFDVHLRFYGDSRWYVYTKPLALSQRPLTEADLENDPMDVVLEQVRPNFELKQLILNFGDAVEVTAPEFLRMEIKHVLKSAINRYNSNPD